MRPKPLTSPAVAIATQEWLNVDHLEALTGGHVSKWTWRRWAQEGKIASAKVGRRLLISRKEYERIMQVSTRPARAEEVPELVRATGS